MWKWIRTIVKELVEFAPALLPLLSWDLAAAGLSSSASTSENNLLSAATEHFPSLLPIEIHPAAGLRLSTESQLRRPRCFGNSADLSV